MLEFIGRLRPWHLLSLTASLSLVSLYFYSSNQVAAVSTIGIVILIWFLWPLAYANVKTDLPAQRRLFSWFAVLVGLSASIAAARDILPDYIQFSAIIFALVFCFFIRNFVQATNQITVKFETHHYPTPSFLLACSFAFAPVGSFIVDGWVKRQQRAKVFQALIDHLDARAAIDSGQSEREP